MWIICLADNMQEMSTLVFSEKKKKKKIKKIMLPTAVVISALKVKLGLAAWSVIQILAVNIFSW